MSTTIHRPAPAQVAASALAPTLIIVHIGTSDTTVTFDSAHAARQWVNALDRAVSGLEVQRRGVAA